MSSRPPKDKHARVDRPETNCACDVSSNQRAHVVDASHNVFRSKDISLESTKLQANLTYMLLLVTIGFLTYRRMKLPVFDGVQEALEKHNIQRKRRVSTECNFFHGMQLEAISRVPSVQPSGRTLCCRETKVTDGSSEQPQLPTPLAGRVPWVSTQQTGPAAHYVRHHYHTT